MANWIWFLAAVFVLGANQGGVTGCDLQPCMTKQGCEMFKCFNSKKDACADTWKMMYKDEFKAQYDAFERQCAAGGGGANQGGVTGCNLQPCMTKKDCEMFKCFNSKKDACADAWKLVYKDELKTRYDAYERQCAAGGGAANQGGATDCNVASCMTKKGCEMYKCMKAKKDACPDAWTAVYKDEFKTKYDENEEKCGGGGGGCGSLKASLLFVLASAILVFFRSSF